MSQFVVFGSKYQRSKLEQLFPVTILGTLVKPADAVKTVRYCLIQSFLPQDMFKPSASLALSMSGPSQTQTLSHTRCPYHGHQCRSRKWS